MFLLLLYSTSCSTQEKTYTVEMIDGVKYIHNHAPVWGETSKVKLEFVRKYGDPNETDSNYLFYKPMDIAVDREGNLLVLDSGNFRVQKYDQNGKFLTTIGRRGQGPGELFDSADKLSLDKQGNMYITGLMWGIVLNENGEEIRRFYYEGQRLDDLTVLSTGEYAIVTYADEDDEALIGIFDENLKYIRAIGEKVNRDAVVMGEYGWLENVVDFVLDKQDNFYLSHMCVNRVAKFNQDGSPIWSSDRPLKINIKSISVSGFSSPPRVSLGIGIDHKERVWILTMNRLVMEEEYNVTIDDPDLCDYHIFNAEGVFLGSIPSDNKTFFYPGGKMKVVSDRLFLIDGGEMSIIEYKIVDLEE